MRKLKFKLLTQSDLFVLETDARTLGELRNLIKGDSALMSKFGVPSSSDLSELHLIERETKASYIDDKAVLPATDALFFVSLLKSKGGIFGEKIFNAEMDYEELHDLAVVLNDRFDAGICLLGDDDDLYHAIKEFYESQEEPEDIENFDSLGLKVKLRFISDLLKKISDNVIEVSDKSTSYYGVSIEELNAEAARIYQMLRDKKLI